MSDIAPPPIYQLGKDFFEPVPAAEFPKTLPRFLNHLAAVEVGLSPVLATTELWQKHLGEFSPLPGNLTEHLALKYHGHQFRHYNPEIGDGRGFLFAQLKDTQGRLLDLGTKGSGRTPFSRTGDGRLTLKGAFREIIATEMLESLGVNTSKTFSVFETGEALIRQDEPSPTRAAVLTRLSHSHIRIGSFQRLAFENKDEGIAKLINYCNKELLNLNLNNSESAPLRFFSEVVERSARLTGQWMMAGFVHGVLNTDNINITGESFDYGPFRFLPYYDPGFTAAYFDTSGLYAYGRQPNSMHWNLAQLATVLTRLAPEDDLIKELSRFPELSNRALGQQFARRLGLEPESTASVTIESLLLSTFNFLQESQIDFQSFFFDFYAQDKTASFISSSPRKEYYKGPHFESFFELWEKVPRNENFSREHSAFAAESPPDVKIENIEKLWTFIAEKDDWQPFYDLIGDIRLYGQAQGFRQLDEPAAMRFL